MKIHFGWMDACIVIYDIPVVKSKQKKQQKVKKKKKTSSFMRK